VVGVVVEVEVLEVVAVVAVAVVAIMVFVAAFVVVFVSPPVAVAVTGTSPASTDVTATDDVNNRSASPHRTETLTLWPRTMNLVQFRRVALDAVRRATNVCVSVQQQLTGASGISKGDASPVTAADLAAQAIVSDCLWRTWPRARIVAEEDSSQIRADAELRRLVARLANVGDEAHVVALLEQRSAVSATGASDEPFYWVLDPVDGTKGFLRGDQFAVCLALMDGRTHRPVLAVLSCPKWTADGLLLVAERGRGTTSEPLGAVVRVNSVVDAEQLLVTQSLDSSTRNVDEISAVLAQLGVQRATLPIDSATKYALVATGHASMYLRMPNRADYFEKVWDHAAGVLVLEEAGGVVTDINGAPLDFSHGRTLAKNRGILATNGADLHQRALAAIAASCVAPIAPTPPQDFECCGNGCEPCVFEVHDMRMTEHANLWKDYQRRMAIRGLSVAAPAPPAAPSRLTAFEEFERQLKANR
jgi:3'(2'), 5'-bisphosphate nucleotidase